MFTHWWVSGSPQTRWALDSGPSFGYRAKGVGGGACDALLCENEQVLGVLEVEGTRQEYTAEKLGNYFKAELDYYRSISFGILALYAYSPTGRGEERTYASVRQEGTVRAILQVAIAHPDKQIVFITVDKEYRHQRTGVRTKALYYAGEISRVTGCLFQNGQEVASALLYGAGRASQ
ncbi:MAG: hypothetical protein IT317_22410 [Anaerolineales bacterium]|nr:hypothetical protein [Anaerolineales bacterium]